MIEAARFYETRTPGLGAEFLVAVEEALEFVERHPEAAPLVGEYVRRLVMPRFPHNVVYTLLGGEVRILAVAHQSRSPTYWLDRS